MRSVLLRELAAELGGEVVGDDGLEVSGVATLEDATASEISFYANPKYRRAFLETRAGCVIVSRRTAEGPVPEGVRLLVVDHPYLAFTKVARRFYRQPAYPPGIDPRAHVEEGAEIDPSATVLAFAYVGRGVRIGARTVVHAHCAILDRTIIGEDCLLYPGVVVREETVIGDRTIVQPGAVIGGDGFGFAFEREGPGGHPRHLKVPQVGRVQIGSDVEIGANTCVDRGTLGDTRVGAGAKVDNLVQIAHNVEVGPLSLMAGCSAVAGSTKLGTGTIVGGQVGIIGHLDIGAGAQIAAGSKVYGDLEAGGEYGGHPAIDQKLWLREQALRKRLPQLVQEIRELRKRLAELEEKLK